MAYRPSSPFRLPLGLLLLLSISLTEGFRLDLARPASRPQIKPLHHPKFVEQPCLARRSLHSSGFHRHAAPKAGGDKDFPSLENKSWLEGPVKTVATLVGAGTLVALAAAAGGIWIDSFSTVPCQLSPDGCQEIPLFMKVPLVGAHLFSFMLIPASMSVFWTRAQELEAAGARNPLTALVGISLLMVAIAGEIGWHVTQEWFYVEDYSILNFMFYFFLNLGSALWAVGIREEAASPSVRANKLLQLPADLDDKIDVALLAAPVLSGVFYLLGAAALHTKVPIYILLSFVYAVLTQRFWKLLDTAWVLLFPAFSVGVNLFFISLLDKYQADPVLNPLFHILHDAAGTELGITIITAMTYYQLEQTRAAKSSSARSASD